jgi:tetratricopeptide (TPR) repeat protein
MMRSLLVCLLMLGASALPADSRIDRAHAVEDPAYGDILFDYYQRRYFAAMSKTLVALEINALPTQRDRARVLLGATYVRYGMPDEAEALFRELLSESVDPELASRVWLNLADLYYRKQQHERALTLLDEKVPPVPPGIEQSWQSLRVRTLMKLGRYDDIARVLDDFDTDDPLNAYLKYNLAVSRINADAGAEGEPLLRELVNLVPGDDEVNAVKDKALLALGLYYLRQDEFSRARQILGAARLQGPFSDTALLLHAQSWLESEQPRKAMGPLEQLSQRSIQHESVQAARLALPHLYLLAGNPSKAERLYRDAIRAYNEHFAYTEKLRQQILEGRWFEALVSEPAWSTAMDPLPPFEPNRVESFATFAPLFATHAFQNTWRDYHELTRQLHLIEAWRQRMPGLLDLLKAHERKHEQLVPAARTLLREVERRAMSARFHELRDRLQQAIRDNDFRQFATEDEAALLAALDDAEQRAQRWPERIKPEIRRKFEFYRGVLAWQIQEDIVPRQWQRLKVLRDLGRSLERHDNYVERVAQAAAGDTGRLRGYRQEYMDLGHQMAALYGRGQTLLARHRRHIESLALTRLQQTRERLRQFTALAWDSLGDIHNEAIRARGRTQPAPVQPSPGVKSSE